MEENNQWWPPTTTGELLASPWYLGLRRLWPVCRTGAAVVHQQARAGPAALASWASRLAACAAAGAHPEVLQEDTAEAWRAARSLSPAAAEPGSQGPLAGQRPRLFENATEASAHRKAAAACHRTWLDFRDKNGHGAVEGFRCALRMVCIGQFTGSARLCAPFLSNGKAIWPGI